VVYPHPEPLPQAMLQILKSIGHDRESSRRGPGAGVHNLRDYQPGDDSRRVHWKTSARQSRLIVRETEAEDQRMVTLALPTAASADGRARGAVAGRFDPSDPFERTVGLVASLAAHFHREGFAVRLLVGDQEVSHGTGEGHLDRILHVLALCGTSQNGAIPAAFSRLSDEAGRGEFVLLVLHREDAALRSVCRGVTQIFEGWR
jgi:uncharacterized protein (DUF58 family)